MVRVFLDRLASPGRRRGRDPRRVPADTDPGPGSRRGAGRGGPAGRPCRLHRGRPRGRSSSGWRTAGSAARTVMSTTSSPNPPRRDGICDLDGSRLVQRADDEPSPRSAPGWPSRCRRCSTSSSTTVRMACSRRLTAGARSIDVTDELIGRVSAARGHSDDGHPQVACRDRADAPRRPGRGRGPRPDRGRAAPGRLDGTSRCHRRGAHPRAGATPSFKGYPGSTRAALPGQRSASRSTTRSSTASPASGRIRGRPDRVGRRRRHRRRLAWRRCADLHRRRPAGRGGRAHRPTREAMMAGIAAAVPGNHIEDISAAVEDVAARRRLRRRPPVRRPRHRHRDARGSAGPELPHRPARPQARGRPVPGHRADVHPGRLRHVASSPTAGPSSPPTARWRPISSTRSPSPIMVRRS